MKQGRFLGDALVVQLINFLVKPAWLLLIDRGVQQRLPPEEYGNYFSLFAFSLIFTVLLDPGLNSYQTARYARQPEKIQEGLPSGILLKLTLSVLYLGLLMLGALFFGLQSEARLLLVWIGLNQVILSWILYFRSFINALHLFRIDALISAGDKLLAGIFLSPILFLGFGPGLNLSVFIGAQSLALLLVLIISAMVLFKRIQFSLPPRRATLQLAVEMFKSTWPFALLTALMLLFSRLDAVMLRLILPNGNEAAGVYAYGFRLLEAVNMIPALFAGMLLPVFSSNRGNAEQRFAMLKTAWMLMLIPAIFASVFSLVFSDELASLLYPGNANAGSMIQLLLPAFLPYSVVYVYGTLLTAENELRKLNIAGAISLILNLGLNLLLIPALEAQGAAIATLFTQSVFAGACFWLAGKKHWPDFTRRRFMRILLPVLIWILLIVMINSLSQGFVSLIFAAFLTAVLLGILLTPYIRKILKSEF